MLSVSALAYTIASTVVSTTLLAPRLEFESSSAPVSALVWWIIPITALIGGLSYAYWVTRLKSKFDNQTERSVGRFKKFQDSFQSESEDQ